MDSYGASGNRSLIIPSAMDKKRFYSTFISTCCSFALILMAGQSELNKYHRFSKMSQLAGTDRVKITQCKSFTNELGIAFWHDMLVVIHRLLYMMDDLVYCLHTVVHWLCMGVVKRFPVDRALCLDFLLISLLWRRLWASAFGQVCTGC